MARIKIETISSFTAKQIETEIEKKEPLYIEIDSCGGDFYAGLEAYEAIRNSETEVYAEVKGKCFSAATIIFLAIKPENRNCTPLSQFLIHSPILSTEEINSLNLKESEELTSDIRAEYDKLKNIYLERLSASSEVIDELMTSERIFDANYAKEIGMVGSVKSYLNKMNQKKNRMNLFVKILNKFMNEASSVETEGGEIFEVSVLPVEKGAVIEAPDGVYKLTTGETITVEAGVIIDVIAPELREGEKPEETVNEEAPIEEVKEEVKEVVEEEIPAVETKEDLDEVIGKISEIIEEKVGAAVEAALKQKSMCNKSARKDFSSVSERKEKMSNEEIVRHYWMRNK